MTAMRLKRIFAKQGPPVNRWIFGLVYLTFVNLISDLARSIQTSDRWELASVVVFLLLYVLCWPILAIRRLIDVGLSWLWVVPLAAIYAAAIFLAAIGHASLVWPLGAVVALLQVPLLFLSPRLGGVPKRDAMEPKNGA